MWSATRVRNTKLNFINGFLLFYKTEPKSNYNIFFYLKEAKTWPCVLPNFNPFYQTSSTPQIVPIISKSLRKPRRLLLCLMASSRSLLLSSSFLSKPSSFTSSLRRFVYLPSPTPRFYPKRHGFSTVFSVVTEPAAIYSTAPKKSEPATVPLPSNDSSDKLLKIRHTVTHSCPLFLFCYSEFNTSGFSGQFM